MFLFLFLGIGLQAQDKEANWVRIPFDYSSRMYMDVNNIQKFNSNDYYVWTLEENFPPVTIESVEEKIYSTKTFYLFNNKLNKYSIIEVIYYDKSNNVLNSFSYRRETEIESYKYNYPISESSLESEILKKVVQVSDPNK